MLDYRTCMLPWDILLRLRAARQKYSSIQGVTVLRKKWLKGSLLDYKRAQQQLREAYTCEGHRERISSRLLPVH